MAKPQIKHQTIIDNMVTRFSAITAGDDYYTTFDEVHDYLPEDAAMDKASGALINIRDVDYDVLDNADSSDALHDLRIPIEIDIVAQNSSAANIRKMIADVLKSIGTDVTWGVDGCYDTQLVNITRDRVNAIGKKVANATITVAIDFRNKKWMNNG